MNNRPKNIDHIDSTKLILHSYKQVKFLYNRELV